MGTCQYEHNGVKTCNIDTKLFKDSNQEDLFPDLCYFHGIGAIIQYYYQILKDKKAETDAITLTPAVKNMNYDNSVKQLSLFTLSLITKIPKPETFYVNLKELMENKPSADIDISGFCFPIIKYNSNNVLFVNYSKQQINFNNNIKWQNISGYSIDFIQTSVLKHIANSIFQPIIVGVLTNLYRELLKDDLTIPLIQDHTINNTLDADVLVDYIYENDLLDDVNIRDIYILKESMPQAEWLNDKLKSMVVKILKSIDIKKVLSRNSGNYISQDTINRIESRLLNILDDDICKYITLDNPIIQYQNAFSQLTNLVSNNYFYFIERDNRSIEIEFQNIILNGNIEILERDNSNIYSFGNCVLNSPNIDINVNALVIKDNTHITEKNVNMIIKINNTSNYSSRTQHYCLIKNSKIESKNITIKSTSLNIEYTELHSDNTEKIELHVPFNKLNLKNPFSKKRLFGEKAVVDIYDV